VTMQLTGIEWSLVSYGDDSGEGVPVLVGTRITAYFDEGGEVNGSTGCNHYTAMYTASGESMTIENLAWTEMACLEPEAVMVQETVFLTALEDVAGYEITAYQLTMRDEEGNVVLEFMAEEG
jgi:heat shock protein HslJ